MIGKDPNDTNNSNKYRPISVTNAVIKLIEKVVQGRVIKFLGKY